MAQHPSDPSASPHAAPAHASEQPAPAQQPARPATGAAARPAAGSWRDTLPESAQRALLAQNPELVAELDRGRFFPVRGMEPDQRAILREAQRVLQAQRAAESQQETQHMAQANAVEPSRPAQAQASVSQQQAPPAQVSAPQSQRPAPAPAPAAHAAPPSLAAAQAAPAEAPTGAAAAPTAGQPRPQQAAAGAPGGQMRGGSIVVPQQVWEALQQRTELRFEIAHVLRRAMEGGPGPAPPEPAPRVAPPQAAAPSAAAPPQAPAAAGAAAAAAPQRVPGPQAAAPPPTAAYPPQRAAVPQPAVAAAAPQAAPSGAGPKQAGRPGAGPGEGETVRVDETHLRTLSVEELEGLSQRLLDAMNLVIACSRDARRREAAALEPPSFECPVCLEARPRTQRRVLQPCGHVVCDACGPRLLAAAPQRCPIARCEIYAMSPVYD